MAHPISQALCDRAEILARSHPIATVAELIGVHYATVYRMRARGWKAADYGSKKRPVPTDFAFTGKRLTVREIYKHYRAGPVAVRRWFAEKPVRPRFKPGTVRQLGGPWSEGPTNLRGWGEG